MPDNPQENPFESLFPEEEPSATEWLHRYICLRLAEHYPELWDRLSPEVIVLILELALDGMSRYADSHEDCNFVSSISFYSPDKSPE